MQSGDSIDRKRELTNAHLPLIRTSGKGVVGNWFMDPHFQTQIFRNLNRQFELEENNLPAQGSAFYAFYTASHIDSYLTSPANWNNFMVSKELYTCRIRQYRLSQYVALLLYLLLSYGVILLQLRLRLQLLVVSKKTWKYPPPPIHAFVYAKSLCTRICLGTRQSVDAVKYTKHRSPVLVRTFFATDHRSMSLAR